MSEQPEKIIETLHEAISVARQWAEQNDADETRCEALAGSWFDAEKDPEQSTARALRSFLQKKTGNTSSSQSQPAGLSYFATPGVLESADALIREVAEILRRKYPHLSDQQIESLLSQAFDEANKSPERMTADSLVRHAERLMQRQAPRPR